MSKSPRHPFLTFVFSGLVATVLIGGAIATVEGVKETQGISSQAYGDMNKNVLVCGSSCRADNDCGMRGYCLLPKKAACPPGKMCADVVTLGVCRAAACSGDVNCSCAPGAKMKPMPTPAMRVPMRQAY